MMRLLLFTSILLLYTLSYLQTKPTEIKYLALGDSYTIGESVEKSERFSIQLAEKLRGDGFEIEEPVIIAKTGWTTDELTTALDQKEPIGKYDFVTLLIGVNNQYRGRDAEEFRKEFVQLLNRAAGYTSTINNVIVVSIPDWGVTPFAIKMGRDPQKVSNEIELYNSIKREETSKAGAHFINITDISKNAATDKTLLAEDELHPSAKMYSLWVEKILPVVKSIIKKE